MKIKRPKIQIIFPGDWIEYVVINNVGKHEVKIGMVLEIKEDLDLIVSTGGRSRWLKREDWYYTNVKLENVIRKFPRFGVLPIPGSIELNENDRT